MSELKTCPFCGGKAKVNAFEEWKTYTVSCQRCGVETIGFGHEQAAVDAWNRRAET